MSTQPIILAPRYQAGLHADQHGLRGATTRVKYRGEGHLKLLVAALFLPEGLSFFIGDFRLSVARVLLIFMSIAAMVRFSSRIGTRSFACIPSDVFAPLAGIWMVVAAIGSSGIADGLKGGGVQALEFTGAYFIFRSSLGGVDSAVRQVTFFGKLIVVVVAIALLDPLSGRLFTYETIRALTGYTKDAFEWAMASQGETIYRNGYIRAMGPMEHSILFGLSCVWFGTLTLWTFPRSSWSWCVAMIAFLGVFFSQSQGSLASCLLAGSLALYFLLTKGFAARWRVLGAVVGSGVAFVFVFSGSPIATLLRLGGISAETGWYRQAIWEAAVPVVLGSPLFGIGLTDAWDWQAHGALVGASVDALWLELAMSFGLPGSLLVFLTVIGAFWKGAVHGSPRLSPAERRLSVALGIITVITVFQGFTVHLWGTCWVLLGVFAGMRASLAESAIVRGRVAVTPSHRHRTVAREVVR